MHNTQQLSLPTPCITPTIPYTPEELLIVLSRDERLRYFHSIPWTLFTTHDVTRPLGLTAKYALWPDYLDDVRSHYRDTIGLLWSIEQQLYGHAAYRIAPHWHCMWVSNKPLDPVFLEAEWMKRAGTSGKPFDCQTWDGDPKAIEYLLKWADRPDCDWGFTPNLEMFMPAPVDLSTSQARRRYARHVARNEQVQNSETCLIKVA